MTESRKVTIFSVVRYRRNQNQIG